MCQSCQHTINDIVTLRRKCLIVNSEEKTRQELVLYQKCFVSLKVWIGILYIKKLNLLVSPRINRTESKIPSLIPDIDLEFRNIIHYII